jgi:hypothetical protein
VNQRSVMLAVVAIAATFSIGASAAADVVVPNDSALDEYMEAVPGHRGERVPTSGNPLPPDARHDLEQLGPVGEQAAQLAEATGEPPRPAKHPTKDDGGLTGVIGSVIDPVPGGIGWLLPLIFLITALVALGYYIARRRTATPEPSA